MRKIASIATLFLFTACSTVKYITVEQLTPGSITLPENIKSVAVLNNFNQNNVIINCNPATVVECDGKRVTDSFAHQLAESNYFNEVVISDSALCDSSFNVPHILTPQEVKQLCNIFVVDMLITVDYACAIDNNRLLSNLKSENFRVVRTRETIVYSIVHYYFPNREKPLKAFTYKDVLHWNNLREMTAENIQKEAENMAAVQPAEPFLPKWQQNQRAFFTDGCPEMRQAEVYLIEGKWNDAYSLWEQISNSKGKNMQKRAWFNMALYFEMNDNINKAFDCLNKAKEIEMKKLKTDEQGIVVNPTEDYYIIQEYHRALVAREKEILLLDAQLNRINEIIKK